MQYESEIETAIVNLRTAKIQLLQLLDDRTPVDQFDVTGPFDFSDTLQPLDDLSRCGAGSAARSAGCAADNSAIPTPITNWPSQTALPIRPLAPGTRITPLRITLMARQTIGVSVSIPLRIFDRNQGEKKRTLIDIDRSQQAERSSAGTGLQRRGHGL